MARKISSTGTIPILDPDPENNYRYFTLTSARLAELGNPSYIILKAANTWQYVRIYNNTSFKILVHGLVNLNDSHIPYGTPTNEFVAIAPNDHGEVSLSGTGGWLLFL